MSALPVVTTLRTALEELTRSRAVLLRATLVPASILAVTEVVVQHLMEQPPASKSVMAYAYRTLLLRFGVAIPVSGVTAVLMAVACHRIVLLGPEALPSRWGLHWSARELAFLGRTFVFGGVPFAVVVMLSYFIMTIDRPDIGWITRAAYWLLTYPIARLSLVLPSIATDQPMTFAESWRMSSGNGWRLTAVLVVGPACLIGLQHLLDALAIPEHALAIGAQMLLFTTLGIFEIVAPSVSFRNLRPTLVVARTPAGGIDAVTRV
jgi:hypothetical protein